MKEPYWLTVEECLALHEMMLSQSGGGEGLRDRKLLESATAKPRQLFAFGKPTRRPSPKPMLVAGPVGAARGTAPGLRPA